MAKLYSTPLTYSNRVWIREDAIAMPHKSLIPMFNPKNFIVLYFMTKTIVSYNHIGSISKAFLMLINQRHVM